MPTPPLANNFQSGLSDGTAITTANSGGPAGDAFSAAPSSTELQFSTTHPHSGSLGMRLLSPTAGRSVQWTGFGSITTNVYFRVYLYLTALPTGANYIFLQCRDSTNLSAGTNTEISVRTDGKVGGAIKSIFNAGLTGAVNVATNQQVRIEVRVLPSTTVGEVEWRLFNSAESVVASDTKVMTGQVLNANADSMWLGADTALPTNPFSAWLDDIAVSTDDWIGPVSLNPGLAMRDDKSRFFGAF